VTEEFIKALERHFPDRCPELSDPDRNVWFKAGQVSVVRFLKRVFEEQHEENKEPV
jgi:hypothetical protein